MRIPATIEVPGRVLQLAPDTEPPNPGVAVRGLLHEGGEPLDLYVDGQLVGKAWAARPDQTLHFTDSEVPSWVDVQRTVVDCILDLGAPVPVA